MKANRGPRITLVIAAAAGALLAASCSERRVEPSPAPSPTPTYRPPPPRPAQPNIDWRDAPITPGDWSWSAQNDQSVARFAGGTLTLRCDLASRTVTLERSGGAAGPVAMTLLTSNGSRQLTATPQPGPPQVLSVSFAGRDTALDAIAFSRGRFALETPGLQTLYVPSWPEISRVVEDCR